jgi:putative DNA primase/helicase
MSMPMNAASVALDWIERHFFVVPIPYREKKPVLKGWQALRIGKADIPRYFNGQPQNVGVLLGEPYGAADMDLDTSEAIAAAALLAPKTGMVFGRASKPASHRFYRADPPVRSRQYVDPTDETCLVELRCLKLDDTVGYQTVVPGSVHKDTGEPIRFEPGFDREPANVAAEELERAVGRIAAAALLARHWPERGRHSCELALAGVLARAGWPEAEAVAFTVATYKAVPTHDCGALARVEHSVRSTYARAAGAEITGFPTLVEAVGERVAKRAAQWLGIEPAPRVAAKACLGRPFTDLGNAERFTQRNGGDVRYCFDWRCWLFWDGVRWKRDATAEVRQRAKQTVRAIYSEAGQQASEAGRAVAARWALRSESATAIEAMLKLAQAEDGIPITAEELDTDRWLLNVLNGTINLRTGELLPHRRESLISKLAPVEFDPAARCPRFQRFLAEVFAPHPDIVAFIQDAMGYSLTGDTREECLFLMHGPGRNGKGTFLKILSLLLGDYAGTADFCTFVQRPSDSGPRDDVANMRGRRFVSAQESREGAALAESLIKWLTGGDLVRARRLYENSTEFDPSWKIWLATNHRPVIRGTDPAIWSRIKLIPFDVSFEGREDRTLKSALHHELPGILNWAIEGCLRWQEDGLGFPECVLAATSEYRAESDQTKRFIAECCVTGPFASAWARTLYVAYQKWTVAVGEEAVSEKAFAQRLKEHGFDKRKTETGAKYGGLGLRAGEN